MGCLGGEHLDDLAVLEAMVERHHSPVDLCADAAVPDVGVDAIGEVHRRRSLGQGADVTSRREDEDLVLEDVDLDGVDEGLGVEHLLLPVHEQAQPREALVDTRAVLAALVSPVRRHPVLRGLVHLLGADLHLHRLAGVRQHCGVQRLITVALGHRDVVLEPARERLPERVHHAERAVAVLDGVHQHADRDDVVDLAEFLLAAQHLLVDAVRVLGASGDLRAHAEWREFASEDLGDVAHERVALLAAARQPCLDQMVVVGIELHECEVLELSLDLPDTEAMRERRVDVERFAADAKPALGGVRVDACACCGGGRRA